MPASETAAVVCKRVYETPAPEDGLRVLVDRLWPRGLSRERAAIDRWARGLAPSTALRTWYGHEPERFAEFRRRYLEELASPPPEFEELVNAATRGRVTLLFAARDAQLCHALVLRDRLLEDVA